MSVSRLTSIVIRKCNGPTKQCEFLSACQLVMSDSRKHRVLTPKSDQVSVDVDGAMIEAKPRLLSQIHTHTNIYKYFLGQNILLLFTIQWNDMLPNDITI